MVSVLPHTQMRVDFIEQGNNVMFFENAACVVFLTIHTLLNIFLHTSSVPGTYLHELSTPFRLQLIEAFPLETMCYNFLDCMKL